MKNTSKVKTIKDIIIMKRVIDNAKYHHPEKTSIHGAWIEGNYQVVMDGYRILVNYNPIEELEVAKGINGMIEKITYAELNCTKEIELPSVKEIKEEIKKLIGRKYRSYVVKYRIHDDMFCVNAKYLLDCMEFTGATKLKYNPNRRKNDMLLMESDIGKAILLPIFDTTSNIGYWKVQNV